MTPRTIRWNPPEARWFNSTTLIYYYEKLLHQKNKWPATTAYILWFALSMRIMNDTRNREKPVVFDTNYTHSCLVHDEMLNDERTVHSSYLVSCDDNSKVSLSHFLALTPYLYDYTLYSNLKWWTLTTCLRKSKVPELWQEAHSKILNYPERKMRRSRKQNPLIRWLRKRIVPCRCFMKNHKITFLLWQKNSERA